MRSPDDDAAADPRSAGVPADDHLLRRIAADDEEALCQLYDRWARQVYALAAACTSSDEEADTLVEEIFWHVWHAPPDGDPERSFGIWLGRMVRERGRTLGRRTAQDRSDGDGDSERLTRLLGVLGELLPEHRETLELACHREMKLSEIAAETGAPPDDVRTWVRSALEILRRRLGESQPPGNGGVPTAGDPRKTSNARSP
ncbi:hypothetical protein BH20GEM2_BH20GEM2_07940 [soil metagenome]